MAQWSEVVGAMFSFGNPGELALRGQRAVLLPMVALVAGAAIAFFAPNTQTLAKDITWSRAVVAWILFVLGLEHMLQTGFNPFLYFQF